jgi:hypothetical protein
MGGHEGCKGEGEDEDAGEHRDGQEETFERDMRVREGSDGQRQSVGENLEVRDESIVSLDERK